MAQRPEAPGDPSVSREAVRTDAGVVPAHPAPRRWLVYGLGIAAPLATLGIRLAVDPWMGHRPALIWFMVPIILVAYRGGLGPGLVATGISCLSTDYFLANPRHTLSFAERVDLVQWLVFAACGTMVSVLSERLHLLRRRAEKTVSDLARAQARLVQGEERLRIANDVAGVGTYDSDLITGRGSLSPEMHAILGIPVGAGDTMQAAARVVHPDDAEAVARRLALADDPAGNGTVKAELRVVRPDGEVRWLSWAGRTFFRDTPEGRLPVRRVGACIDVTVLRRAEQRLATQNAVSRVLAEAATLPEATPLIMKAICEGEGWDFAAFWLLDAATDVLKCAATWCRDGLPLEALTAVTSSLTFGRGVGLPGRVLKTRAVLVWSDIEADGSYLRSRAALAAGLRSAMAFPILLGDRVTGVFDFLGRRIAAADPKLLEMFETIGRQVGVFFDRKAMEEQRQGLEIQLRQAQKMEAIGQLSGGIAHDFNNILTAISANLQLAIEDVGRHHAAVPSLRDAARATERAVDLVRQILLFARKEPAERRVIDLREIGEQSVKLLRATLPAGVDLRFSMAPDVPPVWADATQIQQVIMNLGTNAWHALGHDSGRIEVSIEATDIDAERAGAVPGRRTGRWVRLGVRDTGAGMDEATLERIFEPFFTTKGPNRGTGLGLAVVHGIVASHDGAIAVASRPGAGTTFEIYLPPAGEAPRSPARSAAPAPHGGGEHVLFIDDEPLLGRSASRVLERSGYQVTTFFEPRAALEHFASRPEAFALVITDMNMPRLSGMEVARTVRERRADLPILLLSGNVADELRVEAASLGVTEVYQKPWTGEGLSEIVNRLIRGAPPPRTTN